MSFDVLTVTGWFSLPWLLTGNRARATCTDHSRPCRDAGRASCGRRRRQRCRAHVFLFQGV